MSSIHATDSNFESTVLHSDEPVLVDFWAPWCGPCRTMSPVVDELANEFSGRAKVVKVNVDEAPESARRYNVMSIPAFALIRAGNVESQMVGVVSKDVLRDALEAQLATLS